MPENLSPDIHLTQDHAAGIITLNRPEAYNALNYNMVCAITDCLKNWQSNKDIALVTINSASEKIFCAGGDIRAAYYAMHQSEYAELKAYFIKEYSNIYNIASYPKPILAFINGLTFGGGMGLAMHAHYRIVNEDARLGMPETTIGFFPDIGAGYFYNKLQPSLGLYLALTGDLIGPQLAIELGLASHFVTSSRWQALRKDVEQCRSKVAIEACLKHYASSPQPNTSKLPVKAIEECFNASSIEEILAKLENHHDPYTKTWRNTLLQKSPTSLKVTFEMMKRSQTMTLKEVIQQDLILSQNFINHPDFAEGIRAQLIDKDRNPKWSPNTLKDINSEMVERFFLSSQHIFLLGKNE